MNKVPVFLHIPKNAGTYVLSRTMSLFRAYGFSKEWNRSGEQVFFSVLNMYKNYNEPGGEIKRTWLFNLQRFIITENGKQIATVFVHDPHKLRENKSIYEPRADCKYCTTIELKPFMQELKTGKLMIFSIIIEDNGVIRIKDGLFETMLSLVNSTPSYYTIFRGVFERAKSLFYYLKSGSSSHEPTHKKHKSRALEEYLCSYELWDSWLIRTITGLPYNEVITESSYNETCKILDKFKIKDISETDLLIQEVFTECYGSLYECDEFLVNINKNKNKITDSTKFEAFDKKVQQAFLARTEYDRKLYNKYVQ